MGEKGKGRKGVSESTSSLRRFILHLFVSFSPFLLFSQYQFPLFSALTDSPQRRRLRHEPRTGFNRTMHSLLRAAFALCALLLSRPLALQAQVAPDSAAARSAAPVFVYVQYGDTIAFEAVDTDTVMVRGVYLVPNQGRIAWDHLLRSGTPSDLSLSFFPPLEQGDRAFRRVHYVPKGDSMVVVTWDWDRAASETRPARDSAIAVFGRSMTHIAYLGFYAVQARRSVLPLFLTSSAKTVSATVRAIGETLTFVVDGLRVESDWEGGALLEVRVPSQGLVVRRLQF